MADKLVSSQHIRIGNRYYAISFEIILIYIFDIHLPRFHCSGFDFSWKKMDYLLKLIICKSYSICVYAIFSRKKKEYNFKNPKKNSKYNCL